MLLHFITEMYHTKLLKDAETICKEIFDVHEGCLIYSKIYTDPRITKILKICWVFRNIIGCNPSKLHTIRFFSNIQGLYPSFIDCIESIKSIKFFYLLQNSFKNLENNYNRYCLDLKNYQIVKHELNTLLKSRFEAGSSMESLNITLYNLYNSLIDVSIQTYFKNQNRIINEFYIKQKELIEANTLLSDCLITGTPLNNVNECDILTLYDVVNYNFYENSYLIRTCYNQKIIILADDLGIDMIKNIHSCLSIKGVYFTESKTIQNVWHNLYIKHVNFPTQKSNIFYINYDFLNNIGVKLSFHNSIICKAIEDCISGAIKWNKYIYKLYFHIDENKEINYVDIIVSNNTLHFSRPRNTVMIIDNRPNPLSVLSCLITGSNLAKDTWNLVVYTSQKAKSYYKEMLPFAHIISDNPLLNINHFQIQDYNKILKDSRIWKDLLDLNYEKVLIIQDDGMLVRIGVEEYLGYDYIGAPWLDNNELLKTSNPQLVGNGGLSLRNIKLHYEICKEESDIKKERLFNNELEPIPEDVFFSNAVYERNGLIPLTAIATEFCSEQILNYNSLGFHKIWGYHTIANVEKYFSQIHG